MSFPLPCHVEDRAKTRVVETLVDISLASQALPDQNKKGESLEDFDHVLDMVGHGWAWFARSH